MVHEFGQLAQDSLSSRVVVAIVADESRVVKAWAQLLREDFERDSGSMPRSGETQPPQGAGDGSRHRDC